MFYKDAHCMWCKYSNDMQFGKGCWQDVLGLKIYMNIYINLRLQIFANVRVNLKMRHYHVELSGYKLV